MSGNRSAGYVSGEGLVRYEGVLTSRLGFAGLAGQPATATLQPWRKSGGVLSESVLDPIIVTNRNPEWAWPADSFLSVFRINGEYRPITHSGYNWVMHSQHDGAAFVPRANRWLTTPWSSGPNGGTHFEPDYTDVADFVSESGAGTVERLTVNSYANNTISEVTHTTSTGHVETLIEFTGSNATFDQYAGNIYTLIWLDDATYDPSERGAIGAIRCSATRTNDRTGINVLPTFGTFAAAIGVCCRQGGNTYVKHSPEATFPGNNPTSPDHYAFKTRQQAPMSYFVADDFAKISASGYDSSSHPDFSESGGELEFGYFVSPGDWGYNGSVSVAYHGTVRFAGQYGVVTMSVDFSRLAIAISPG